MNSVSIDALNLSIGGRMILKDVTAEIPGPGSVVLFGPNGAGKSTLLKVMAGIISPRSGDVRINGYSIGNQREKALSQLGAHIEPGTFYPQMTGMEVLSFIEKMRQPNTGSGEFGAESLIEKLGMSDYAGKKIGTYSTGMKRILSVASAIVNRPPIILLDEPTDGLDPVATRKVSELIKRLHKENDCLVITTSHDMEEAEFIATRKLILMGGTIAYDSLNSGNKVSLSLTVSDLEPLDSESLNGFNYKVTGKSIVVSDLNETELGEALRKFSGLFKVESISLESEFRRFYGSSIEKYNSLTDHKEK